MPKIKNVVGVFISVAFFMFGFEQLQEILGIWRDQHWNEHHAIFWGIHTINGLTYDLAFGLMFVAFALIFVCGITWHKREKKKTSVEPVAPAIQ